LINKKEANGLDLELIEAQRGAMIKQQAETCIAGDGKGERR
jgi:hypothetical protein